MSGIAREARPVIAALVGVLLIGACDGSAASCVSGSDCPTGHRCINSVCVPPGVDAGVEPPADGGGGDGGTEPLPDGGSPDGGSPDGGPPPTPACRIRVEEARGVVDTQVLRVARNDACVCGGGRLQYAPIAVPESGGGARVFIPYTWAIAELELDASGRLGTGAGVSPMLAVATDTGCGNPWTLGGDHGAGRCQNINMPLQVAPSGRIGLIQMPYEMSSIGGLGFFVRLGSTPLPPIRFTAGECRLLFPGGVLMYPGLRQADVSSNVSNLGLMGVVTDASIGEACPPILGCESGCAGQSFAQAQFDERSVLGSAPRIFADADGNDLWVAAVDRSLVVVDLTSQTPANAIDPWLADTQITFSPDGAITATRLPGGVLPPAPADSPRPTLLLGPTATDHVAFVGIGDRVVAVDLGDDGRRPTALATVTGSPLLPTGSLPTNPWGGPFTIDGGRYAIRDGGTTTEPTVELWNIEPDGATLVGTTSRGRRMVRPFETTRGVFLMLAGGTSEPSIEILSITAWARTGDATAARRPLLDGPLSAVPLPCTSERCYRVDLSGLGYSGSAMPFASRERIHFLGTPNRCGVDDEVSFACEMPNDYHLAYECDP